MITCFSLHGRHTNTSITACTPREKFSWAFIAFRSCSKLFLLCMPAWPASLTQQAWLQASHTTGYAAIRRLSQRRSLTPAKQLPVRLTATAHTDTAQDTQSMATTLWKSLDTSRAELTLNFTLPTGQSFRWRRTAHDEFTGVVDSRVVSLLLHAYATGSMIVLHVLLQISPHQYSLLQPVTAQHHIAL